jgi:nitrite reductase/ring-hydroxylating ferredoxin subunit
MSWHKVAELSELADGVPFAVGVNDEEIALFLLGEKLFATSNVCTHQHAYLSDGYVDGDCIECPLHGGRFSIETGEACGGPVKDPLKVYPIKIDGDSVFVAVD